jgi:hypothetical protein
MADHLATKPEPGASFSASMIADHQLIYSMVKGAKSWRCAFRDRLRRILGKAFLH